MALPSRYVPRPRYPTGWQASAPMELASNLYRYGSSGRPGVASVNFAVPGASTRGSFDLTSPDLGAAGPTGDEEVYPDTSNARNPNLATTAPDFMESPAIGQDSIAMQEGQYEDSRYPGRIYNPDGTVDYGGMMERDMGKQPKSDNPLNSAGLSAQSGTGRDTSTAGQSQRYYDRKFAKMSRDPVERTFARRIDARAENVSRPLNSVRFNNSVAGHSPWQPSQNAIAPAPVKFNNEVAGHKDWTAY